MSFIQNLGTYITGNPVIAIAAAFLGGLLTASNPCVLAMIPLMLGFVGGYEDLKGFRKSFFFSLLFVFGLSVTFTGMGLVAALFGKLFGDVGAHWNYIIFAICVVMAIHLFGFIEFKSERLSSLASKVKYRGAIGALSLGVVFGFVSAPCAAPILAVILTYIAKGGNAAYGGMLLFAYAVGHCALIIVAGTSLGLAGDLLASEKMKKANLIFKKVAGVLIFLVGVYFLYLTFE
jgi:cytochrome c-type biogenesis protein